MPTVTQYKVFNGKKMRLHNTFTTKEKAQDVAKALRSKYFGYNVRITERKSGSAMRYMVWFG